MINSRPIERAFLRFISSLFVGLIVAALVFALRIIPEYCVDPGWYPVAAPRHRLHTKAQRADCRGRPGRRKPSREKTPETRRHHPSSGRQAEKRPGATLVHSKG